ncbi:hypothetical protein EDD11_004146 [Mortierella claussenii]|nr:hypothetical protein EDD11_004146 [Mortierella claussenii]
MTMRPFRSNSLNWPKKWHSFEHNTIVTLIPRSKINAPAPSSIHPRRKPSDIHHIRPPVSLSFFKSDIPNDEIWEQFLAYPKNSAMGYEPPKLPSIIQCSKAGKSHDTQLRTIQKRIAHLTRPVDLFLHQIWSLEGKDNDDAEEMAELCTSFAILIRDQLGAVAGRINTMRMDNLRASQGATFKSDALDLVDPLKLQEEIKSIKAAKSATRH